jgi:hypothetical protein
MGELQQEERDARLRSLLGLDDRATEAADSGGRRYCFRWTGDVTAGLRRGEFAAAARVALFGNLSQAV